MSQETVEKEDSLWMGVICLVPDSYKYQLIVK